MNAQTNIQSGRTVADIAAELAPTVARYRQCTDPVGADVPDNEMDALTFEYARLLRTMGRTPSEDTAELLTKVRTLTDYYGIMGDTCISSSDPQADAMLRGILYDVLALVGGPRDEGQTT